MLFCFLVNGSTAGAEVGTSVCIQSTLCVLAHTSKNERLLCPMTPCFSEARLVSMLAPEKPLSPLLPKGHPPWAIFISSDTPGSEASPVTTTTYWELNLCPSPYQMLWIHSFSAPSISSFPLSSDSTGWEAESRFKARSIWLWSPKSLQLLLFSMPFFSP